MRWKRFLILGLLSFMLISASPIPVRLVRLTIINKSGKDIELSLTGDTFEQFYYLKVRAGIAKRAEKQVFTVVPDRYASTLYYVELWDPVYGSVCDSPSDTLDVSHNTSLAVQPCTITPANSGEASIYKFGGRRRR
jgi:hypothetical protein